MKLAVASSVGENVDQHFGKTPHFLIFTLENNTIKFLEIRDIMPLKSENHQERFENRYKALMDCNAIIYAKIGKEPLKKLQNKGIIVVEYKGIVEDSIIHLSTILDE
ncbi:MAG: NifB/NifX family molybdenum-iron cluster-binding protein [Methanobacteriaceae archaeon]|nr:NifB/NifX family molybdenum-iron cluster-binding protein [Methanobacteriaceae archaeon]